jgi:23S rRNA (cytidine1920-2'-O)/16S rRNA (cytidine1409-2'-O)-methyltransferase
VADERPYASRGGEKLAAALRSFGLSPRALVCADFGSHVGGFVDCLLRHEAARVYAVDTGYGTLAWSLRKDPRVVTLERTNAMHVVLPERVALITIDVGWTPQEKILPSAAANLAVDGIVVTLIKPQYEAVEGELVGGVVPEEHLANVAARTLGVIASMGWAVSATSESPLPGHAGNREVFALLRRAAFTTQGDAANRP